MVPSVAPRYVCLFWVTINCSVHVLTDRNIGRDVKFLDRMKDHTMAIFMGALLLNCTPPPLHFVFGPVLTWVSGFFAERAMKRSRPFVKERLEKTAQFKAVPKFGWTPPVKSRVIARLLHKRLTMA